MITEPALLVLLSGLESFRVERTVSTKVGADDKTGAPAGLKVTGEMLRNLAGLSSDGNILPAPAITVYRVRLSSGAGEIAVVEVQPSDLPPVRFKGQTWIRRGPRKGIANEVEESILIERRTAAARTFDAQPCAGARGDPQSRR